MTERIAVLTDIHGNAPALRAALDEIQGCGQIDRVFCLGDAVNIGPDTNEVLDLLCGLPNLTMVTGNHERYVVALAAGKESRFTGEELAHQQWITARLEPRFLPFLQGLPQWVTVTVAGRRILLQHLPFHPVTGAPAFDGPPSPSQLADLYAASDADVICFGHYHFTQFFRSGHRVYLNPGALGCGDRPVARYGILTLDPSEVDVELREVPYDNRAFLASYERLGVPARDFILRVFHGNQLKAGR